MTVLADTHPYLYQQFEAGNHPIRRSQRYWAGLWSDLAIEQTLMRSIKTRGGLTRGRGMEEGVSHLWVSSLSYTAAVHEAMTDLSGIKVTTSEQHLEMSSSRRKQDYEDANKFYNWFESRNPFTYEDADLHSLSTGAVSVNGTDNVNCEEAESIGEKIQSSLDDKSIKDAKIKRKDEAKSIAVLKKVVKTKKVQST
jgi:hypothetical protein